MQIASRFTIAIHTLICLEYFKGEYKLTSEFIARSTCCNPVIIRRILSQLAKAGLIKTKAGVGGSEIIKPLSEISLLDIFHAVNAVDDTLFSIHNSKECPCPVGKTMHGVLDGYLSSVEEVIYKKLSEITLQEIFDDSKKTISENK